MEVIQLQLASKNKLVNQYILNNDASLFHYHFQKEEDVFSRYDELMKRDFPRKQLAEHIKNYMQKFGMSSQIEQSIQHLKEQDSVVVIGGQQAGLLTGPLYTIHKVFSIIHDAKEKEKILNKPVVPIFWIAGEDHDILEVNHVYKLNDGMLNKSTFEQKLSHKKQMVSKVSLNKEQLVDWIQDVIASFGETSYTKDILSFIHDQIDEEMTYTEFFAKIINSFFKEYGLLLVDSAHPELRQIEQSYFKWMVENGELLTDLLLEQQQELANEGYGNMIDSDKDNFQLFYEQQGERVLLQYDRKNERVYAGENSFAKSDLLHMVEETPGKFSNNVVTRPLMQEFLFPTLSFIAGPGEISYWAELKKIFEFAEIKMPIIVPRINITYLERNIESDLNDLRLNIENVLINGVEKEKVNFIESLKDKAIEETVETARTEILAQYEKVYEKLRDFDKGLLPIIDKNSNFITNQLDYLLLKTEDAIKRKYHIVLNKYDRIGEALYPFGGFQERCWNIFYFLNQYGLEFINEVCDEKFSCNGNHYVIKL